MRTALAGKLGITSASKITNLFLQKQSRVRRPPRPPVGNHIGAQGTVGRIAPFPGSLRPGTGPAAPELETGPTRLSPHASFEELPPPEVFCCVTDPVDPQETVAGDPRVRERSRFAAAPGRLCLLRRWAVPSAVDGLQVAFSRSRAAPCSGGMKFTRIPETSSKLVKPRTIGMISMCQ